MTTICNILKHAIAAITGLNESVTLFQWLRSLRSSLDGTENQQLKEDDVLKLQTSVQCLRYTVLVMEDLINRAEWKSHDEPVAKLLPELKAAFYDAEELLEGFRYYELKEQIESGVTSLEPDTTSFCYDIQGDLDKFNCTKKTLDDLCSKLQAMGLHQATLQFDRSIRPETTGFPKEAKIFGRDDEIKDLIGLLGVPTSNRRGPSTKRKRSANNEASIPVLPIVGIGGVGKTTLAQTISNHPQVKRHFDEVVWICVSDDFDVERLTKEAIDQLNRRAPTTESATSLQNDLAKILKKRRSLIVLDDVWTEKEELWKTFYGPFNQVREGSMMLVTTRSDKVANIVGPASDHFVLKGLKDDVFHNFFKLCVFGSDSSNVCPELERICRQILPKLKGSPLAAKTIGRLLGTNRDLAQWNMILKNQLWEHKQESTDILPALRLSYMYLPFHLKRCFSFCAVYPKDYNFVKEELAEIWVAEGFVEPQNNIPLQQIIACKYFEELEYLSFFQKLHGKYVMHDLIHDMAQLVSKDDCFIIKEKSDLERIPQNVRHLSVLKSRDFKCSDLGSLCKKTKLRTLLCHMSLKSKDGNDVIDKWCAELFCMRVMVCDSISKWGLPNSISNMKNLRYLKIVDTCFFKNIPAALCRLYNLQLLYARKCSFEEIPRGFSNLTNRLQKFESQGLNIDAAMENGEGIKLLADSNLITRDLYISNVCAISQDQAVEIELMKKNYISSLTLKWSEGISLDRHNEIEVFHALRPPTSIKSVCLECYPGVSLPSWSSEDPTIISSSLTEINVKDCPRLSSLEHFLQSAYFHAINRMEIEDCPSLESIPVERIGSQPSLEILWVRNCPKIKSQRLLAPHLKRLFLIKSGNLGGDIDCGCLTIFWLDGFLMASLTFHMPLLTELHVEDCQQLEILNGGWPVLEELFIKSCPRLKWVNGIILPSSLQVLELQDCGITHIPGEMWSSDLKSLRRLSITECQDLESIGGPEAIAHIREVDIGNCPKLKEIQQPLRIRS